MFNGEFKTYLDVRQFVEAAYGPLDEQSEILFLTFLSNALDQMWADIRSTPWFLDEWTVTGTGGVFTMPENLANICTVTSTVVDGDTETVTSYQLHLDSCSQADGTQCAPQNVIVDGCSVSRSGSATVGASTITLDDDTVTEVRVAGYRRPGRAFFTVVNDCRVWGDIDLDVPYRSVYAKAVAGMLFFGTGDAPRGADWLNLANTEFTGMIRANARRLGSARDQGMYRLGSKRYLAEGCCCDMSKNWRLMW